MKRNSFKQILLLVLTLVIIFGGISYLTKLGEEPAPVTEENVVLDDSLGVTLIVDNLYEGNLIAIEEGETVLKLLERLNEDNPDLKLTTKDFGDMGVLIDAMGGQVNGTDDKYWQYEVNEEAPMVGADQYVLEKGDQVVWEFKASEF